MKKKQLKIYFKKIFPVSSSLEASFTYSQYCNNNNHDASLKFH